MPRMGVLCGFHKSAIRHLRRWPVREFENWLIFYQARRNGVEIVHVITEPVTLKLYWMGRVRQENSDSSALTALYAFLVKLGVWTFTQRRLRNIP
jgi:hypothetical protein